MTVKVNEIDGYKLFNDIEDKHIQSQNRSTVLANIIEDNLYDDSGVVTEAGMYVSLKYWEAIPEKERALVYEMLRREVESRKLIEGGLA